MTDKILSAIDDSVGTLTFNNPERHNAMSLSMWRDAATVLDSFAQDANVRVILLTGAGGKSFVSGADISKFESERSSTEAAEAYGAAVEQFSHTLINHPKPTIAMIRGYCIGGGVNIAVCCDLRFCNEKSRFAVPAAKLGLGYGPLPIARLMDLVGPQFTTEILLTARQFDAAEALRIGLVNRVLSDAEIEAHVHSTAETIAANAPLTIRAAKRIIRELLTTNGQQNLEACEALVKQCFESEDYREGRRAFMEKRKPQFTGH
jgi:enoyl-CoA hydratase